MLKRNIFLAVIKLDITFYFCFAFCTYISYKILIELYWLCVILLTLNRVQLHSYTIPCFISYSYLRIIQNCHATVSLIENTLEFIKCI